MLLTTPPAAETTTTSSTTTIKKRRRKILWIGGSSQLARCYYKHFGSKNSSNNRYNENDDEDEEEVEEELYLVGYESSCPFSLDNNNTNNTDNNNKRYNASYLSCDLTSIQDTSDIPTPIIKAIEGITSIIISIRPVLFSSISHMEAYMLNDKMLHGLQILLQYAMTATNAANNNSSSSLLQHVIHVSSVAAANHLSSQNNLSEDQEEEEEDLLLTTNTNSCDDNGIAIDTSWAPYDRFKRQTEQLVKQLCNDKSINNNNNNSKVLQYTNLRLSGLLFEEGRCIVSQSFGHQAKMGLYVQSKIDMNAARNVAWAIRLLLKKMDSASTSTSTCTSNMTATTIGNNNNNATATATTNKVDEHDGVVIKPIYYYTRPMKHVPEPVSLGYYTRIYQRMYNMKWYEHLWFPYPLYVVMVYCITTLSIMFGKYLPFLQSTDYLLRVAILDHTFDNTLFLQDFPEITKHEISVQECLATRMILLQHQQQQQQRKNLSIDVSLDKMKSDYISSSFDNDAAAVMVEPSLPPPPPACRATSTIMSSSTTSSSASNSDDDVEEVEEEEDEDQVIQLGIMHRREKVVVASRKEVIGNRKFDAEIALRPHG